MISFRFLLGLLVLVGFGWLGSPQQQEPPPLTIHLPLVTQNYTSTWSWANLLPVQLDPEPNTSPLLALDAQARPVVLWDRSVWVTGPRFLYYSVRTDQGWSPAAPISQTLGESHPLDPPVLGPDGRLHLVWRATSTGGPYRLAYASWDGNQWSTPFEFLQETTDAYPSGIVRLTPAGEPGLLARYSQLLHLGLTYTVLSAGGSETWTVPNPNAVLQAWLDNEGGVRLYGDNWPSPNGRFDYWKGGSFIVINQEFGSRLGDRAGTLDGDDNLHLFRLASVPIPGGTVTGLYHQCLSAGLAWDTEQVLSGMANLPMQGYRIALSPGGRMAVGWMDPTVQTITVTTWKSCAQSGNTTFTLPPSVTGNGWASLEALAYHDSPPTLCALARERYQSGSYGLSCASLGG